MKTLFDDQRLSYEDSIALTVSSLKTYGTGYDHWAIAFSGGKDSSTVLSLVLQLLSEEKVPRPKTITVLYADTRQELPPLHFAAMEMLNKAGRMGCSTKIVCASMAKRFWPYILGRGVPSPNNGTLRWCTRQIKVDPMTAALERLRSQIGSGGRLLMLTGVRQGESAARDQRISVSCSKDGGECGQGWFQKMTVPATESMAAIDTLAPILHWRVCHVWDWLVEADLEHGYPTMAIAEAYSMTESIESGEEPLATRTGCIGCPLVSGQDTALAQVCKQPQWAYLSPLLKIRAIHDQARNLGNRLRKVGGEAKKDGSLVKNQGRYGPIKIDVRLNLLEQVLAIQRQVNDVAIATNRPQVSLINEAEELFIRSEIADNRWPHGWTGTEPGGEELLPEPLSDGSIQPILFEMLS